MRKTDFCLIDHYISPVGKITIETHYEPLADNKTNPYETWVYMPNENDSFCAGEWRSQAEARTGHNAACVQVLFSFSAPDIADELNEKNEISIN